MERLPPYGRQQREEITAERIERDATRAADREIRQTVAEAELATSHSFTDAGKVVKKASASAAGCWA